MSNKLKQDEDLAAIFLIKKLFDKNIESKSDEELTNLDRIVLELKNLLGSKTQNFNKYNFLKYTPISQATRYITKYNKDSIANSKKLDKDLKKNTFSKTYKRK